MILIDRIFNYLERYGIKPSLGERSIRRPPASDTAQSYLTNVTDETTQNFDRLQLTTAETEGWYN
jgi:hypothetical protein